MKLRRLPIGVDELDHQAIGLGLITGEELLHLRVVRLRLGEEEVDLDVGVEAGELGLAAIGEGVHRLGRPIPALVMTVAEVVQLEGDEGDEDDRGPDVKLAAGADRRRPLERRSVALRPLRHLSRTSGPEGRARR